MKRHFKNEQLDELIGHIAGNNVLPQEASILAQKFYKGLMNIVEDIHNAKSQVALLEPVVKIMFSDAIKKAEGSVITEKKINAECDINYIEAKRQLAEAENDVDYLENAMKTIEHGFIFYRQKSQQ